MKDKADGLMNSKSAENEFLKYKLGKAKTAFKQVKARNINPSQTLNIC